MTFDEHLARGDVPQGDDTGAAVRVCPGCGAMDGSTYRGSIWRGVRSAENDHRGKCVVPQEMGGGGCEVLPSSPNNNTHTRIESKTRE